MVTDLSIRTQKVISYGFNCYQILFQALVLSLDLQDLVLCDSGQKEMIKSGFQLMIFMMAIIGLIHTNIALLDLYQCKKGVMAHSICTPEA